jgi:hypothetical protein
MLLNMIARSRAQPAPIMNYPGHCRRTVAGGKRPRHTRTWPEAGV